MNNTMDDIDNKHIIDNAHFSETQYKLVNMNGCTVLDEIYQYLENNVDVCNVEKFQNLIQTEEYDSDCIEYDMPNGNIFNRIQLIQNEKVILIHAIVRIVSQARINNKYNDIYFKYNDSLSIFPGVYEIHFKNKKLFGDKYILFQTIDE
eukprot:58694_1